eukprot:TRINITY_DN13988_c0_g1_i1.p1 TRINITY_DN13988_c0_g1~~TRINITY_DN13988_c0_g1_i1.p1  ORF type:complete len:297 (-),score=33.20 TRINITY_DN13988_c0_g1_i1:114-1004(-)
MDIFRLPLEIVSDVVSYLPSVRALSRVSMASKSSIGLVWGSLRALSVHWRSSPTPGQLMRYFYGSESPFCSKLTNLTSLSINIHELLLGEMQLISMMMQNNPKLSSLSIVSESYPSCISVTHFAAMPLDQLTELNLYGVMLSSQDLEQTIDILSRSPNLRTLRSINVLCNFGEGMQVDQPTPARCDYLLQRLVSSLTNLTVLQMVTEQSSLESPNVSFAQLTKLTKLATGWKELTASDLQNHEPAKVLNQLKALYPPQLQDVRCLLITHRHLLHDATPFSVCTPLHAAAAFAFFDS